MATERWTTKYNTTKPPQEWFALFAAGKETLEGISRSVGVSRETIRNDFVKLVGKPAYLSAVRDKRERITAASKRCGVFHTPNDYFQYAYSTPCLAKAVQVISKKCKDIARLDFSSLRSPFFCVGNKDVLIRYGELKPTMRDFPSGYLRFKVAKDFHNFDAVAFFIFRNDLTVSYIIPPKDVLGVQSLALRAKEPLCKGKYRKYLENWDCLQR